MKKRLRKKKHCGNFTEWGRRLVAVRNTCEHADAFHDSFLVQAIEANGCYSGGSLSGDRIDVVVELGTKRNDPDAKFQKVTAWLDARQDVESWSAGPLVDLWHGNLEDKTNGSEPEPGTVADKPRSSG